MPRNIKFEPESRNNGFPAPPGAHVTRDVPVQAEDMPIARTVKKPDATITDEAAKEEMQQQGGF